jgi:beta-glucanase (GH16 family)
MRKLAYILILITMSVFRSYGQLPPSNPMFDSVFVDNFNGSTLDTSKWLPFYGWGGGGANFYDTDTITGWCGLLQDCANIKRDANNRTISGGVCKLITKKENTSAETWHFYPYPSTECTSYGLGPVPWGDPSDQHCLKIDTVNFKYTNAVLTSRAKFKYGYFEMSFRIFNWSSSTYNGFSPTFWLFNNRHDTMPWSEIDIFEIDGTSGKYTVNVHVDAKADGSLHSADDYITPGNEPLPDLSSFHKAGMYWSPDSISFYLDNDRIYKSINPNDTNNYLIEMPMIIENVVSALNFCRNVDYTNTTFPIQYEIEYVKVYQPKLACDSNKIYCNTSASTFNSKLYKTLVIGGSGCSALFNNGTATAEATDYVLLDEGFEIGTNMTMLITTENCWSDIKYIPTSPSTPSVPYQYMIPQYKQTRQDSHE